MRLLLDTHALVWWLAGDERLPRRVRAAIGSQRNASYVSAASAWEIATKHRIGRWPGVESFFEDLPAHLASQGFIPIDITFDHAQRAGSLPGSHRDPFDRMLAAQAHADRLVIASNDEVFDEFGVARLWE